MLFKNSLVCDSFAPWEPPGGDLWSTPSNVWTGCFYCSARSPLPRLSRWQLCPLDALQRGHQGEGELGSLSARRVQVQRGDAQVRRPGPAGPCACTQLSTTRYTHTHRSCVTLTVVRCLLCRFFVSWCLSVFFVPPVYVRDDVYWPLGSQDRSGGGGERGVGLREADEGFLEWSSFTGPPAQCCWCLEPGTAVCVQVCACALFGAVIHTLSEPLWNFIEDP